MVRPWNHGAGKITHLVLLAVVQLGRLDFAPNLCPAGVSLLPQAIIATLAAGQAALCSKYDFDYAAVQC